MLIVLYNIFTIMSRSETMISRSVFQVVKVYKIGLSDMVCDVWYGMGCLGLRDFSNFFQVVGKKSQYTVVAMWN